MSNLTAKLTQPLEDVIRRGHPWVFHDAVHGPRDARPGTPVDLLARDGSFIGCGVWDPESPIRVRMWTLNPETPVNNATLESRIRAAIKSKSFPTHDTTGFRALNGEGDRIPGVVCDVYDNVAVFRVDGLGAERWIEPASRLIQKLLGVEHVAVRRSEIYAGDNESAEWIVGGVDQVKFLELGMTFVADPLKGQKTGFFLDQRANRQRLAEASRGKRLLNLFGYSGAFSVAAAMQGAARTTTVDIAKPALVDAERHFNLNGLAPEAHEFVAADVFKYHEDFWTGKAPFDVVVCDPPSFAHRKEDVRRATTAYLRLFAKVFDVMPNGSRVALASCSSHISRERFVDLVIRSAQEAGVSYVLQGVWGADVDHTTLAAFPEGDYLQFSLGTIYRD
jgi:23S rRNA (cytosine1962-C5)-methyltransferase